MLDLDRGVVIKRHQKFGVYVAMYTDEPGVYRDARGQLVAEKFAASAGFDTARYAKERRKREKLADFMAGLAADMEAAQNDEDVILEQSEDYRVVQLPMGRAKVVGADGAQLHPLPLTEAEARILFRELAGEADEAAGADSAEIAEGGEKDNVGTQA